MKKLKLTKSRQECFLQALAETGSVIDAVRVAGTSRTRVYELRKVDPAFSAAWSEAEDIAADRLEDEARRRAVERVSEPLVSGGKLVRDDSGQPITVRRYSDGLLMALLKARRRRRGDRSIRFRLPLLQSAGDAPNAIASIAAAVAEDVITPAEAGDQNNVMGHPLGRHVLYRFFPPAAITIGRLREVCIAQLPANARDFRAQLRCALKRRTQALR